MSGAVVTGQPCWHPYLLISIICNTHFFLLSTKAKDSFYSIKGFFLTSVLNIFYIRPRVIFDEIKVIHVTREKGRDSYNRNRDRDFFSYRHEEGL